MAPPRTSYLADVLQTPMSLAVIEEDNVFFVGSSSGLHEFRLSPATLTKTIRFQLCTDVLIAEMSSDISTADKGIIPNGDKLVIAVLSLSANRLGAEQDAVILCYRYERVEDRRTVRWKPVIEMPSQRQWGRIRKIAYSKKRGCLLVSTKFDHEKRGVHQSSAIWMVHLKEPAISFRLVYKHMASMWYMCVYDERDWLIVSDRGDDAHHTIDIYDMASGSHLKTIASSPAVFPDIPWVPYGRILWPRGVAVDSRGLIYVVDGGRIQEFDGVADKSDDSQSSDAFVGLVANVPFNNPKGMVLVEKSHSRRKLYVIGCQDVWRGKAPRRKRHSRTEVETPSEPEALAPEDTAAVGPTHSGATQIAQGGYSALFTCDVQDWCPCEECVKAVEETWRNVVVS